MCLLLRVIQPHNEDSVAQANYVMSVEGRKYVCEVVLPGNSPLHSAIGHPSSRKSIAKRSAAFEACLVLRKSKHLNEHFLPIYKRHLPAMRNALLALNLKRTNAYPMLLKPTIWQASRGEVPEELFLTIIDLAEAMERPHCPIALLTRVGLPQFPRFPLFLNSGGTTDVVCTALDSSLRVTNEHLEHLTSFTLRIFKDVFNKTFERDFAHTPYWLAPVNMTMSGKSNPKELLDWDVLRAVHENEAYQWTPDMAHSTLQDRFIVDPWDGGRRFFSVKVVPDLKPMDPVPAEAVKFRHNKNIMDYSVSLYKTARARATWDPNQPVIQVEKVLHRRNMLAAPETKEQSLRSTCYVCPEPLRISAVSLYTLRCSLANMIAPCPRCCDLPGIPCHYSQTRLLSRSTRDVQACEYKG